MGIFEAIAGALTWLFRGWRCESEARGNYSRGYDDGRHGREPAMKPDKPREPEWFEDDWQHADAFAHAVGTFDELEPPYELDVDPIYDRSPTLDDMLEAEENEAPRPSRNQGIGW